ncbi:MarR family winged helix-turn-helix transcriptional regulator [Micromonospora sp. RHAY321]|uniref:MarR family winged helix-turn-helix transcriptional regulator n=1 Tax=Micromonospora sp. RHAY321 TaxID=2944807 RepID=UPI00207D66B1|nr:MarR family winged helix-turn-helix transcriptional regulator [Micromonospora sp. RHAY321]MCO1593699.1 MarR family winged helix-turn-helix transcriptional regulator [Micromonospora sp. RHAY321]
MTATAPKPDLGALTGQLMRALQEELFETLGEQGHPDVRPRHGSVLAFLEPEGVRSTDLSARSGQHKQVIGTIVDELVSLGYVRREPDPADRRAKLIVPTEHGLDEIAKARAILATIEQRLEHTLGEQRFATFREAFQEVTHLQRGWRQTGNRPA